MASDKTKGTERVNMKNDIIARFLKNVIKNLIPYYNIVRLRSNHINSIIIFNTGNFNVSYSQT